MADGAVIVVATKPVDNAMRIGGMMQTMVVTP